jgi:aryl-alcohol dehydrogenase-like predicted oxidoreductase
LCLDQKIGVISYFGLAAGFLTGKYSRSGPLPETTRAEGVQKRYMNDHGFTVLDRVLAVAKDKNVSPSQVALAWLIARPSITAPIASATSAAHVKEIVAAADLVLTADEISQLDKASEWKPA